MIKQIIIKHTSDDIEIIINDILKYLDSFIPSQARVVCSFCLNENDMTVWSEIDKNIKSAIVQKKLIKKSVCKKTYLDIELF